MLIDAIIFIITIYVNNDFVGNIACKIYTLLYHV
jgi:hypothetical protein